MNFNEFYFFIQLGSSSSQLTNSYFSAGQVETTNQKLFFCWFPAGIDAANVHSIFEEHYVAPTLDDAIATTSNTTGFEMTGTVETAPKKIQAVPHVVEVY